MAGSVNQWGARERPDDVFFMKLMNGHEFVYINEMMNERTFICICICICIRNRIQRNKKRGRNQVFFKRRIVGYSYE